MTDSKGVAFTAPPDHLLPDIRASIDRAVATLEPGKTTALIGVVTETGANAVLVMKQDSGWSEEIWFAKQWDGKVTGGFNVKWSR